MMIKIFIDDIFYTNTYVVIDRDKCIIIDPGFAYKKLIKYIKKLMLKPLAIIATHGHIDHIWGVDKIKKYHAIPFYMSIKDLELQFPIQNIIKNFNPPRIDYLLEEGVIEINGFKFRVIETPGHTPGSVTILYRNIVFTGDTLFKGSIGRTDLGGDINMLIKSIHDKLFKLPRDTLVYPGHGEPTTIGYEIINNPYVGVNGIYPFRSRNLYNR